MVMLCGTLDAYPFLFLSTVTASASLSLYFGDFPASRLLSLSFKFSLTHTPKLPWPSLLNASVPLSLLAHLSLARNVRRRRRNISPRSTISCENQSWDFLNSENSAGSEDKSRKKAPGSSSNSQTEIGMEAAAPVPSKKKRAGRGGVRKNGDGMIIGDKGKEEERGAGESDHEIHIWTERERRKKMRNMFTNLHALLPHLPPKVKVPLLLREC